MLVSWVALVRFALSSSRHNLMLALIGSGKSTLAMSILRFVSFQILRLHRSRLVAFQADPSSGRIIIDGIDISTIGIHDLRSRLVGTRSLEIIISI